MICNTAPNYPTVELDAPNVFLAGSINMGSATLWQDKVIEALSPYDVNVYNPRRSDWDSSWKQEESNEQFNEQVTWELDGLESADLIVYFFDSEGMSPITLLELGLHAQSIDKHIIVCCSEGYARKGNVDILCTRYQIPRVKDLTELIESIEEYLQRNL